MPYLEERLGPRKELIPLMAVMQQNKENMRPVMDYQELNHHIDAFTAMTMQMSVQLRYMNGSRMV